MPSRFRAGEALWEVGDPADRVIFLCRGLASLSNCTRDGEARVLEILTRGSVLGLPETLEGGVRASRAVALAPSNVCILPAYAARAAVARGGPVGEQMMSIAIRSIRALGRRVLEVGYGSVEQRVARVAARLAEEHGLPDARGILVPFHLNRAQFAGIVGCRVETLVRTLQSDDLAALLTHTREGMVVHDLAALRRLGDG